MKIIINDHRRVFAIQEEFSALFSGLDIEFFAKPSKSGAAASRKVVTRSKKLLDCRATHEEGFVEISPAMTVDDLKDHFSDAFGLTIQVVRSTKHSSIAIPVIEKHTLEEENRIGTEIKMIRR